MSDPNRYAPKGATWVCCACGKIGTSPDRNAFGDTSCVTHALLVDTNSIERDDTDPGRAVDVTAFAIRK